MKNTIRLISFICLLFSAQVFALTNITTPNVNGNWTLAGSPYIIQVAIQVPAGQTLKIEPGVEIKFWPQTKLNVIGSLIAKGTAAAPITFMASDTAGWSNENSTTGGWSGLHYMQYSGAGVDSSIMEFCTIQDCKYGYAFAVNEVNPFLTYRGLKIKNCNFTHNTTGTGFYVGGDVVNLNTTSASDTVVMSNCTVSDNTSVFGIVRVSNYMGGYTHIHHSHFHHNHRGATIWGTWVNLLFEHNEVNHNEMINDSAPVKLSIGTAIVRNNKVHHNTLDQLAAIGCRSGKIDIENNLICNNHQMDPNCGATGGGGGIHLAHNEGGAQFADTYYRVRNNVIANNRSEYGGGGIYVFTAKAEIMNNTIVNNSAPGVGQAIMILNPASEVLMKNNLFFGQKLPGADSAMIIHVLSANKISFDYNYVQGIFSKVLSGSYNQFAGDTSHNVIGNTPMLISPTANNLYTTDALNGNFDINGNSPSIDKGDTAGANPLNIDFAGNTRIVGSKIDIGAFEYNHAIEGIFDFSEGQTIFEVYPNPANNLIVMKGLYANSTFQLININGAVILKGVLSSLDGIIDVSDLPKGLYLLRCIAENRSSSQKILIQ